MAMPIKTIQLNDMISVDFFSDGNRYFGDFHRVKVMAIARIPLCSSKLPDDLLDVAAAYPGYVDYEKNMERMGVTTAEVDTVTEELIDNFIQTSGHYLLNVNFAERLLRKKSGLTNMKTPLTR